jgi:hypothetical protein
VIARTLARRVVMRTTERAAFEAIRFLECDPEIASAPSAETTLTVEPFRGRYRIREDGNDDQEVIGTKLVVDRLHTRLLSFSLEARPQAGLLHAASLRRHGRRLLIAGRESAGKTTLALRLILAGYEFEGDEHVFVDSDETIVRPRACRVKESSLALFPEFAETIASAPFYVDDVGRKTLNVDPRMIGRPWSIEGGKVDCVIVLQPNHGGYSSLRYMQPTAVAQTLISELTIREANRGALIGAVAAMVSRAKGFDLSLGDHETAVKCIDRAVAA